MVMLTVEPRLPCYKPCCNHSRGEVLNCSPSTQCPGWMWHPPNTYSHWGFTSSISLWWEGSQETGPLVAIKCDGPHADCLWLPWFEERSKHALFFLKHLLLVFVNAGGLRPIQKSSYSPIPACLSFSKYLCISMCLQVAVSDCLGTIPSVFM